jgi:hypothetical protein
MMPPVAAAAQDHAQARAEVGTSPAARASPLPRPKRNRRGGTGQSPASSILRADFHDPVNLCSSYGGKVFAVKRLFRFDCDFPRHSTGNRNQRADCARGRPGWLTALALDARTTIRSVKEFEFSERTVVYRPPSTVQPGTGPSRGTIHTSDRAILYDHRTFDVGLA